ncbi:MAG: elongation factor P [Planctomycetota bacterium]|jgi:elongation factor P
MLRANELRPGKVIIHENALYTVKDATHVAKGNKRSYIQLKLKNFQSGQIIDQRARVDDTFETPFVQTKEYEYLYRDGDDFVLADVETYDQIPISTELIGDTVKFMKENIRVNVDLIDGKIVNIELPHVVELAVKDTPPVVKGATATNQSKDAVLETGARIKVPPFIDNGEVVRVDTRSGEYVERAKG